MRVVLTQGSQTFVMNYLVVRSTVQLQFTIEWRVKMSQSEYKKGTLLQEYFLNPHFKPTEKEKKELELFFSFSEKKS